MIDNAIYEFDQRARALSTTASAPSTWRSGAARGFLELSREDRHLLRSVLSTTDAPAHELHPLAVTLRERSIRRWRPLFGADGRRGDPRPRAWALVNALDGLGDLVATGELDVDGGAGRVRVPACARRSPPPRARHRAPGAESAVARAERGRARRRRAARSQAYWPQPWTAEDGGPRRHGCAYGVAGLAIAAGERLVLAASRDAFVTDALVRREAGRAVRAAPRPARRRRAGGAGRDMGRAPAPRDARGDREQRAAPRRPVLARRDRGRARTASCSSSSAPGRTGSRPRWRCSPRTASPACARTTRSSCSRVASWSPRTATRPRVSSPRRSRCWTLARCLPLCPPLALPEPSIARLSSDGESVIALGTTTAYRLRYEREDGRLSSRPLLAAALRPGRRARLRLGPGR